jgi:FixJ family two-component response regulator
MESSSKLLPESTDIKLQTPMVLIIDDDRGALMSLEFLLRSNGYNTRTFASALDFLYLTDWREYAWGIGCLVVDYRLPEMNGLMLFRELVRRGFPLPVIIVTAFGDIPTCAQAIRDGVFDFVEKPYPEDRLLTCIASATQESKHLIQQHSYVNMVQSKMSKLTPRERMVMNHLLEGHSIKSIASILGTSFQTISKQRQKVFEKLAVSSEVEILKMVNSIKNAAFDG